jgi:hypothetical protein
VCLNSFVRRSVFGAPDSIGRRSLGANR